MAQQREDGAFEAREAYLERLAADIEPLEVEEPDWLEVALAEIDSWWNDEELESGELL